MIKISDSLSISLGSLETNLKFDSIFLDARCGGSAPTGWLKGKFQKGKLDLNVDTIDIKLVQSDGTSIEFTAHVYRVISTVLQVEFKFTALSDEMTANTSLGAYSDLDEAISDNLDISLDSNASSDVNAGLKIHKCNESSYNFLKKVLTAYKRNSIFAFDFGKCIIRDLDKLEGSGEHNLLEEREVDMVKSKFWNLKSEISYEGRNALSVNYNKNHYIYNKDYVQLNENFLDNSKYYTSGESEFQDTIRWIPNYSLGDKVAVTSENFNLTNMVLFHRVILIIGSEVQVTLKFKRIE